MRVSDIKAATRQRAFGALDVLEGGSLGTGCLRRKERR
jgi:heme oxygenase